ncbi:branched-chain amino acid ABC transporter permease [Noviherbaspirillum denitrificans]|uniref:branched-chain amino acid ABC transporter permease n=1 Tax=Noviherbaspirillum denitrificans TaxID=1968433 RepID=UPI000B52BDD4|nr:branched-chain amino acid ABC transporter permease [Noviherbaspirillum denitrificans]
MRDHFRLSMQASHLLTGVLAIASIVFMGWGAAAGDTFYLRLGTEALIFAGLALSVELLLGYTGLLSLGQAMYFGVGAYVSALTLIATGSFWMALGAAFLASLAASFVGGLVANRVRGVYFVLLTFALAQVAAKAVYNTKALGSSDGMIGIPVPKLSLIGWDIPMSNPAVLFLVVALVIFGLYGFCSWLLNTPLGRLFVALRANERRVPFLGYSVWHARMAAYMVAGAIAGISGALYPMLRGFVSPELMFFTTSGNAVIMVILGGVGTLAGALYGATILVLLKSFISTYTEHHLIIIGALFIALVLFVPQGMIGCIRPRLMAWLERSGSRPSLPAAPVASVAPIRAARSDLT